MSERRIAYVVNHVAFFVSHRLPLALCARQLGFEVQVFTGQPGSVSMETPAAERLHALGIPHRRTLFSSSGLNPLIESIGFLQLLVLIVRFKPDIVHCASPKGVLIGGIASRLCRVKGVVLAISGMGYAFTGDGDSSISRRAIKYIFSIIAPFAFGHPNCRVIVQNEDDRRAIIRSGFAQESQITLIKGSGIDLSVFDARVAINKEKMVLLPARMLEDKGVRHFVSAARKLRAIEPGWQFVLAGAAGYDNPTAIPESDLLGWQAEGVVSWRGHVEDMVPLFSAAAIVCLPSYREGMPKALLEAAAAGCAVVTTDVVGCRDAVEPGVTGDLVPVRDVDALVDTLAALMRDDARRRTYGGNGRRRVESMFSLESVVSQTMEIYEGLLDG